MKLKEEHINYLKQRDSIKTAVAEVVEKDKQIYFNAVIVPELELDKDKNYLIDLDSGEVNEQ